MVEITKGYFRSGGVYIHQITIFFLIGASFCLSRISNEYFPEKYYLLNSQYAAVRYCSVVCWELSIILIGVLSGGQFIYSLS